MARRLGRRHGAGWDSSPAVANVKGVCKIGTSKRAASGKTRRLDAGTLRQLCTDLAPYARRPDEIPPVFSSWLARFDTAVSADESTGGQDPRSDPAVGLLVYAVLCQAILRHATGGPLARLGWRFAALPVEWLDGLAARVSTVALHAAVAEWLADDRLPAYPVRHVFEQVMPRTLRRRHGEVYTPAWLADAVVGALWEPGLAWIDPCVGGGAFALALYRKALQCGTPVPEFVGFDANPWALLGAAAGLASMAARRAGRPVDDFVAPLACADLLQPESLPDLSRFGRVVGNPPWVLWDQLPSAATTGAMALWSHYGLLAETGMASILGGGKKDLAMLITYVAADRLLAPGGRLGFVITQSVLKSARSGRGFRRFRLPDGTPLGVVAVDDWSRTNAFGSVGAKAIALFLEKGTETAFPVPYCLRRRHAAVMCQGRPGDPADELSAWRHVSVDSIGAVQAVLGESAYRAYLGVNTGGANGVYFLQRTGVASTGLWRMRNLAERGIRSVPVLDVLLEAELLYPVLLGNDVRAWHSVPSAWVLLAQDPIARRGRVADELDRVAPRCLEYLRQFRDLLTTRAAYRRYFQRGGANGRLRASGPFYSMFDVGAYTLAPVKVIWHRMGSRLAAAVVTQVEGKPVLGQETHAFFPLSDLDEAHYLAALLNSRPAQRAIEAVAQVGGKSFATPKIIHQLALRRFDPADANHAALAELGGAVHRQVSEAGTPSGPLLDEMDRQAMRYWGIDAARL